MAASLPANIRNASCLRMTSTAYTCIIFCKLSIGTPIMVFTGLLAKVEMATKLLRSYRGTRFVFEGGGA